LLRAVCWGAIYLFFRGCDIIKTLIKNGTIVNYDGRFKSDVLIEANRVIKIGKDIAEEGARVIDAADKFIFPGFIDAHTHPGLPEDLGYKKNSCDFFTETRAAKAGGTTAIFDFAEQAKKERLIDALRKRKQRYEGKAQCKYYFHVAITEVREDLFQQLIEIKREGVNSVKLYTTYGMKLCNEEILRVMDCCAKLDMVVLVHCEEDAIIGYAAGKQGYGSTRPREAEYNMVHTIVCLAKITGCKAYICHVSCKESVDIIKAAKAQGVCIYLETCPQYLVFDESVYNREGEELTKYILSPPFRTIYDRVSLIQACLGGTVDLISTDHCAFLYEEHKRKFSDDLNKAAKGIPGIQLRPSLIYDLLVRNNGMSLESFVRLLSYNPAQIFGLKDKGYISEGMSGDLVIWSEENFKVSMTTIIEGTDYSPYEGLELYGKPLHVLSI
jgi:dihydropyrimidinase